MPRVDVSIQFTHDAVCPYSRNLIDNIELTCRRAIAALTDLEKCRHNTNPDEVMQGAYTVRIGAQCTLQRHSHQGNIRGKRSAKVKDTPLQKQLAID